MKHMDIDCYERGCACVSSSRVAGEPCEIVEVVSLRELSDEEFISVYTTWSLTSNDPLLLKTAILKKASE